MQMLPGSASACRRACNIDGIAKQIAVPDQHVAEVKTDTEPHLPVERKGLVMLRYRLLDRERTRKAVGNTRKFREHGVYCRIGDPPPMLGDQRIKDRAARGENRKCAVLVRAHQPTALGDIGGEYCRQPPLNPLGHFPVLPGSARMAAPSEVFTELLREREKSGLFVCKKVSDLTAALGEQAEDVCRRAVPQPGPDHLRRGPVKDAEPLKIFILGYDCEPVVTRVLPDRTIGTAG